MVNLIQIFFVIITLILSLTVGVYALFKSQSYKRNYYLLLQGMVIVFLLGYLLQITSTNTDEAFTAVKVLYLGAYFASVFTFFFIADYCNVKLHPIFIKLPMLVTAGVIVLLMWTTNSHGLIYQDYNFIRGIYTHLSFTPGSIYSIAHHYQSFCLAMGIIVLFYRYKKWSNKYRNQLLTFIFCLSIPLLVETVYFIRVTQYPSVNPLYLTPYSIAVMSLCLYLGVMRYNIFETISTATITAMEHIREGFILLDEDYNYLSSNKEAAKIFPEIISLVTGMPITALSKWPVELKDARNDLVEFSIENGSVRYYRVSISPVRPKNSMIARIFLFREITDNVNLLKELENAAYIDSLTGLYNRKHFTELAAVNINRALRLGQSIFTAMLDLDFFKRVNDTHGHVAGDQVLKKTAEIIHNTIRSYDLLGRYGGEEFVLLLTGLDQTEALKLMERIRENMESNITEYEDIVIKTTCSIGLAEFTRKDSLESSIKKADEALYAAKNAGRNQVQLFFK